MQGSATDPTAAAAHCGRLTRGPGTARAAPRLAGAPACSRRRSAAAPSLRRGREVAHHGSAARRQGSGAAVVSGSASWAIVSAACRALGCGSAVDCESAGGASAVGCESAPSSVVRVVSLRRRRKSVGLAASRAGVRRGAPPPAGERDGQSAAFCKGSLCLFSGSRQYSGRLASVLTHWNEGKRKPGLQR